MYLQFRIFQSMSEFQGVSEHFVPLSTSSFVPVNPGYEQISSFVTVNHGHEGRFLFVAVIHGHEGRFLFVAVT